MCQCYDSNKIASSGPYLILLFANTKNSLVSFSFSVAPSTVSSHLSQLTALGYVCLSLSPVYYKEKSKSTHYML